MLKGQIQGVERVIKDFQNVAAQVYKAHIQASFDKEGFTDDTFKKWKRRSNKDKNRRKRNLLVRTGRLRRGFKSRIRGTQIIIYTGVPYAKIHNEGGRIKKTVNIKQHKRNVSKRGKRKKVTVSAHKRRMNTNIPKRQFLGNSKAVNNSLKKHLEKEFKKVLKV